MKTEQFEVMTDDYNMSVAFARALEEAERVINRLSDCNDWGVGNWNLKHIETECRKYSWREDQPTFFYTFEVTLK